MNILCVDDDGNVLRFFQSTFELLLPEDQVEFAASGMDALQFLAEVRYDLVITDLVMPEISGLDLLQIIKNTCPDTEVLLLTGHASMESALAALREGARDYLEKPVDIPLLLEKVANIREFRRIVHDADEGRQAEEAVVAEAEAAIRDMKERIAAMRRAFCEVMEQARAGTAALATEEEREALLERLRSCIPSNREETS